MADPPKSLLDALLELQAKVEALRQAKQAAKEPGQVEFELQKKLDAKRKQAKACKDRLDKARADQAYFEAQALKAAKAVAVEESLRARFRQEVKELFALLGEPSDSGSEGSRDDDEEVPVPSAAELAREHLRGSGMDVDNPHTVGLALLLAGKTKGCNEAGWHSDQGTEGGSRADAKPGEEKEKPRSRSPKTSRVADAAAAIEAKKEAAA
jgi:hypothetical protein